MYIRYLLYYPHYNIRDSSKTLIFIIQIFAHIGIPIQPPTLQSGSVTTRLSGCRLVTLESEQLRCCPIFIFSFIYKCNIDLKILFNMGSMFILCIFSLLCVTAGQRSPRNPSLLPVLDDLPPLLLKLI